MKTWYPVRLYYGEPAVFKPEFDFEEASRRVVERDTEWKVRSTWWMSRDPQLSNNLGEEAVQMYNTKFNLLSGTISPFFRYKSYDEHKERK